VSIQSPVHADEHDTTLAVVRALWSAHHALEAASERMEQRVGLTASQRIVVRTLGRYPGTTPGQLAELLGVHPGTVSTQIRRLEARGLVTRLRDPRDARRVMLGLTRAGRAFDRPMEGTVEQAVHGAIAQVSPNDVNVTLATLRVLREALARVGREHETDRNVGGGR
jgi:DNA-binding MarR family transcriptional regulator